MLRQAVRFFRPPSRPLMPLSTRRCVLALPLLLLAACGDDPVSTAPDVVTRACPAPTPNALPCFGGAGVPTRFTAEVAVTGTTAYTSTWGESAHPESGAFGEAVYVWDVSGAVPALVDSLILDGVITTGDVQVDETAQLLVVALEGSTGGLAIYSIANPRSPQLLRRWEPSGAGPGIHTVKLGRVNGTLHAFASVNPGPGAPASLLVASLADPSAPQALVQRTMGEPFVHDVFIRDGILFTALWDAGLTIWDVGGAGQGGAPANPVFLGNVATVGGRVHNVWWFHDPATGAQRYAFVGEEGSGVVGQSSSGDLHVVDVSDFTDPREVAVYQVPGAGAHNFWMDEPRGVLYAAYYNAGVRALDVRGDLGTCPAAEQAADGRCDLALMDRELATFVPPGTYVWGVAGGPGETLYASDMTQGIWKLGRVVR